jgi:hypothetical protein
VAAGDLRECGAAARGRRLRRALAAGAIAAAVSGAPSTCYELARGGDPLEPTLAAGSLLLAAEEGRRRLVLAAIPVHLVLSLFWAAVLERALPRRRRVLSGATAGLAIGVLDLLVIGRRLPRIRALPLLPQLADHALFGATVGFVLARRAG